MAEVLLGPLDDAGTERQVSFCMWPALCLVLRLCCAPGKVPGRGDLASSCGVSWTPASTCMGADVTSSACGQLMQLLVQHAPMLQVLIDIGAGMGIFSLAAAARGHKAYAFELSPKSLASLEASISANGFQDLVSVQKVRRSASIRNPEWLAPRPTPEVSSAKQHMYSQGLHQPWCFGTGTTCLTGTWSSDCLTAPALNYIKSSTPSGACSWTWLAAMGTLPCTPSALAQISQPFPACHGRPSR